VQLPPAATLVPQLFVSVNSAVVVIEVMLKTPLVPSVTVCGGLVVPRFWLPKTRLVGVKVTVGAAPVPESETVCGLF
jgi:hypothetical protein